VLLDPADDLIPRRVDSEHVRAIPLLGEPSQRPALHLDTSGIDDAVAHVHVYGATTRLKAAPKETANQLGIPEQVLLDRAGHNASLVDMPSWNLATRRDGGGDIRKPTFFVVKTHPHVGIRCL